MPSRKSHAARTTNPWSSSPKTISADIRQVPQRERTIVAEVTQVPRPKQVIEVELLDPLQRYDLKSASRLLRQSLSKTFVDMRSGALQVLREGRRTFVPGSEIVRRSRLPTS